MLSSFLTDNLDNQRSGDHYEHLNPASDPDHLCNALLNNYPKLMWKGSHAVYGMRTNDPRRTGRGTRGGVIGLSPSSVVALSIRRPALGYVVFVNVSDVGDGFLPDVLGGYQFNVFEPDIRIESAFCGLLAQAGDAGLGRHCSWQRRTSCGRQYSAGVVEIGVGDVAQHLNPGVNVGVGYAHVGDVNG